MDYASREALLGASDLTERDVELPSVGLTVRVRSLPAAYSNEAQSEGMEMTTVEHNGRPLQTTKVNGHRVEALKVLHGLVEPKLSSITEVYTFAKRCGPAWHTVVEAIDDISGLEKDAVEKVEALFRSGGQSEAAGSGAGADVELAAGNGGPAVSLRAGA